MKETYYTKSQYGVEYKIEVIEKKNKTKYKLYRTDNDCWSEDCQGEHLLTITDDGDGLKLDRDIKELDYGQAENLTLLLLFANSSKTEVTIFREDVKTKFNI